MNTSKKSALVAALVVATMSVAQAAELGLSPDWSNGTSGNSALVVSSNSDNLAYRSLDAVFSGNEVFLSVNMALSPSSSFAANDFVSLWLDNALTGAHTSVPNFGIKADLSGTNDVFARSTGTSGSAVSGSNLVAGQSFTLLARVYKSTAAGNYDGIQLWFNPTASDSLASADASFSGNSGISSFSAIGLRTANLDAGDSVSVSNLKVGTAFADVSPVPEPSTTAMLLAGLGMMGFIARRRLSV
ncbi:hypothetical protein GCM10027046_34960 [Uliginosibacterium flavum]|uniref:PEP-CTERM sorting domain-containing protein n=1 Tax=Uliginosibacterium flavum TaxID=1396831 RepID=A0ABV2TPZ8_9RHOO